VKVLGESHTVERLHAGAVTDAALAALDMPESYTLFHLRDIVDSKESASIFSARHSTLGNTAVKVIRTKDFRQKSSIPIVARNWKNEEQLLRTVKHVRSKIP
jgi:hypothetical protein